MYISYPALGEWGRLGNQLWEIAGTIGTACRLGNVQWDLNHWDYEPYFNVPAHRFTDSPDGTPVWEYASSLPESERPYLQDFSLWANAEEAVRFAFKPSEQALEQLEEFRWFRYVENPVSLHVRRDERVEQFSSTHPTPPWAYYEKALEIVHDRVSNPTICVFSDDIDWCRKTLPKEFLFVEGYPRRQDTYQSENEPEWRDHLDLFLMTMCIEHIITNSTYSWWGAYLSRNPSPIYPAVWYGPGLSHINWELQIPAGWIEVNWR